VDSVKLSSFRWLQANISVLPFDFHHWWINLIQCFTITPD